MHLGSSSATCLATKTFLKSLKHTQNFGNPNCFLMFICTWSRDAMRPSKTLKMTRKYDWEHFEVSVYFFNILEILSHVKSRKCSTNHKTFYQGLTHMNNVFNHTLHVLVSQDMLLSHVNLSLYGIEGHTYQCGSIEASKHMLTSKPCIRHK